MAEPERQAEALRRFHKWPCPAKYGPAFACVPHCGLDAALVLLDGERLAELEDWLLGAEHHAGCSGEYRNPDGAWSYRCKCGLRELRDERPVSPSVDPEEG